MDKLEKLERVKVPKTWDDGELDTPYFAVEVWPGAENGGQNWASRIIGVTSLDTSEVPLDSESELGPGSGSKSGRGPMARKYGWTRGAAKLVTGYSPEDEIWVRSWIDSEQTDAAEPNALAGLLLHEPNFRGVLVLACLPNPNASRFTTNEDVKDILASGRIPVFPITRRKVLELALYRNSCAAAGALTPRMHRMNMLKMEQKVKLKETRFEVVGGDGI